MKLGLTIKPVFTWSPVERKLRLFRAMYNRPYRGDGAWVSLSFSLSLRPVLVACTPGLFTGSTGCTDIAITLFGVQCHMKKMAGGYAS